MLRKIFGLKKGRNNIPSNPVQSRAFVNPAGPMEKQSRALKIVHAGGHVECYYMAIPAQRIMEKNPSFFLTRPEIFRRPWDSIVRSNEILIPGQKYYIVPRNTVKKLRKRIKRDHRSGFSYDSKSCVLGQKDSLSVSGILIKSGPKVKVQNLHVSFNGVNATNLKLNPDQNLTSFGEKIRREEGKCSKERPRIPRINGKHRRALKENTWEPSLNSIVE